MTQDPAGLSAADALVTDPFYRAISDAFAADPVRRRAVLGDYFACSIAEGIRQGRVVRPPDPAAGVAVWLLPQPADVEARASREKQEALHGILGAPGLATYREIVHFMSTRAAPVVPEGAWYLSILAVAPALQGHGIGARLLAPTLAMADAARVPCYLETFTPRTVAFYERLGFTTRELIAEPTTGSEYAIMVRDAQQS
jgi:GNAT superfamily N-acetyltransferase